MFFLCFITALCSASFIEKRSDDGGRPGQVHLAYYNETVRSVSWVTFENVTQYLYVKEVSDKKLKVGSLKTGCKSGSKTYAQFLKDNIYPATTELWIEPQNKTDKRFIHHAVFSVEAGTKYQYMVGSETWVTDSFTFSTMDADDENVELLIYGDMGLENAYTHDLATNMIKHLNIDMIMHIGDFCYNLYELNGTKSDKWMDFIEPIATQVPYQTIPGNHEAFFNFTHYESRYKWVSEQGNPHFYRVWFELYCLLL